MLFPEGTDRGERATRISHKFADENGLDRYDYVLHPRTTGFSFILEEMRKRWFLLSVFAMSSNLR